MRKLAHILFFILLAAKAGAQAQLIGGDSLKLDYQNPVEYEIQHITITGTESLDKSVLIALSGLSDNDKIKIPGDKINEAIQNLWRQGLFEDIKIVATKVLGNKIWLEYRLTERPRMSVIKQHGFTKSEWDDIRKKLPLHSGKSVTEHMLVSSKNIIRDHFISKGYLNVQVDIPPLQKDPKNLNAVIVEINLKVGSKAKIQSIAFQGNVKMSSRSLRHAMKETKVKHWYNLFHTSKFIQDEYDKDKTKIVDKYLGDGFRDAHIVKDSVYRINPKRVAIRIWMEEGKKYYFRNITWVGNSKYSSKDLSKTLGIKKGDVFSQSTLESKLFMNPNGTDVSSLYMDDGYLFFSVTPVEVQVEGDSIDLEMRVYEGKQATINKVTVVGNTKTNDHVIMREIRTRPGQLFRRSDIIRSQRELAQLGYFDPEKMTVNPTPNQQTGTVDIEYGVEEKPSDQLELSGGFGAGRVVGTLGVSFTNFSARNIFKSSAYSPLPSGDGQRLSIRAQSTGLYYSSYNFTFAEPWLGGKKPNSLTFTFYNSIQTNGRPKSDAARQSISILGVQLSYGKRLTWPDDYFNISFDLNPARYTLRNYRTSFIYNNGISYNLGLGVHLNRSDIDQPIYLYPTSGSNTTITLRFTPPYSAFRKGVDYSTMSADEKYKLSEYYKVKFTTSWFMKLAGKLVLNTRAGFGMLGFYNSQIGLSPFERFYLGGSGLSGFALDGREIIALRGYDDGSLSPRTGAASIVKYTAELRYPISLNPNAMVYVLGFAEGGNSWATQRQFDPFSVKRSVGLGVRIFLPMFGQLGLDYGWRLDDVPNSPYMQKAQFHFTLGMGIGEL